MIVDRSDAAYFDAGVHGAKQYLVIAKNQPVCTGAFGPFTSIEIAREFIKTLNPFTDWEVRALIAVTVQEKTARTFTW